MRNQAIIDELSGSEIAIIGMAGRFPGAADPDQFWRNLRNGVEAVQQYTDEQLRSEGVAEELLRNPSYIKFGAPLDGMELFDAAFFGLGPKDAAIMDPQHRHFLEVSWEALENAGYDPERFPGLIGVYGGSGMNAYMPLNLFTNPKLMQEVGLFHARHTGNDKDFLTTRVSFRFNLRGPSVNVQTACSTSLVAIHLASLSLLNGECDIALAGGVTIELPHRHGYYYRKNEILSPDGHCRAFDADSEGTIFGSGAGVVVLRRLKDAIEDGDYIHAIVRGSAINNDGSMKASYFAPSPDGQAKAILEALHIAGVPAETISYIEAHGTGTTIGDDIEIKGLTQAYRSQTQKKQFIPIGSVKTNIGHLDTAAGVASLIKVVQAMKHRQLPATLNFKRHNPEIDFENSPFFVNGQLSTWETTSGIPRRAGVSSLGVGGTNAHIILEEAPQLESGSGSRSQHLFLLSAHTQTVLDRMTKRLAAHLQEHPELNLADAAYTLQVGRQAFNYRRMVVAGNSREFAQAIESQDRLRLHTAIFNRDASTPRIAFMFPGGGAQYPNMGRDLYEQEAVYREAVDTCLALAQPRLDFELRGLMFPSDSALDDAKRALETRHSLGLTALFITEYALAQLWESWGIRPAAVIGHSLGEYTAACLAGVFSLADALTMVIARGKLFETLPEGSMLSIPLAESDLAPLLTDDLNIAVINTPSSCVVSGAVELIAQLEMHLLERGIEAKRVPIAVAAHSSMLEPILEPFRQQIAHIRFKNPALPYISNLTGIWAKPEVFNKPEYWVNHLRNTVRFSDGLATLLDRGQYLLLEVGPGTVLNSLARNHPAKTKEQIILASARHSRESVDDLQYILLTLGKLWAAGQAVDWTGFYAGESRYRVPLPTYAFDHQRYWIEPGKQNYAEAQSTRPDKTADIEDWFYHPIWKQEPLAEQYLAPSRWMVFSDETSFTVQLVKRLKKGGHEVITVQADRYFTRLGDDVFGIDYSSREDYFALVQDLQECNRLPQRIIHAKAVSRTDQPLRSRKERYELSRDRTFYSLVFLAQALGAQSLPQPIQIGVISNGVYQVKNEGLPYPEKAILLGPVRVIPAEFPDLHCKSIDIQLPSLNMLDRLQGGNLQTMNRLIDSILNELVHPTQQDVVAYRAGQRYIQDYVPSRQPVGQSRLRTGGVYLITGGLGGVALAHAEYLAKHYQARLVLTSRHGLPARENWAQWLATHHPEDRTSDQIRKVQAIEAMGAQVIVFKADVTDHQQMKGVIEQIDRHFGQLHGVIHAAGILADGLMSTKTGGDYERVLAPKVRGTLILHELLAGHQLDFFMLFSSTSSLLGLPGQADYAGANAFLDAYATSQSQHGERYTLAINWSMWREVGMAADAAAHADLFRKSTREMSEVVSHPLLDHRILHNAQESIYTATYSTDTHWILDEHRLLDGTALIPGTGYVEMACAAIFDALTPGPVVIQDLLFLQPLEVPDHYSRSVQVALNKQGAGYRLSVSSQPENDEQWQEHASCTISFVADTSASPSDVDAILQRCQRHSQVFNGTEPQTRQEAHLRLGPRWKNLRQVNFGDGEALAMLELTEAFLTDLDSYIVHPALLDLATGYGLPLVPGYDDHADLYVPLSYKQIQVLHPMVGRIYSYVRLRVDLFTLDMPVFDIIILDETGGPLLKITEFTIKRITGQTIFHQAETDRSNQKREPTQVKGTASPEARNAMMELNARAGIDVVEGTHAFSRALSGDRSPQVIITSIPLAQLKEAVKSAFATETGGMKFERPSHLGPYVEPRDEIEKTLVDIWETILGIKRVGIEDDFFALGGESLIAVRLFSRLRKAYAVDFSLGTLFTNPTVGQLAAVVRAHSDTGHRRARQQARVNLQDFSSLVPIQSQGSRPPFFCVHGAGGNVLLFKSLANYLNTEQPLYGLQAQGIDGKVRPLTRIEDMAARYIREIRAMQPHGPYYLGGFSMGGEVAFEMAQQLLAASEKVAILVLFDTYNPVRPIRVPQAYKAEQPASTTPNQPRSNRIQNVVRKVQGHLGRLAKLSLREQVDYLTQDVRMRWNRLYLQMTYEFAQQSGRTLSYAFLEQYLWECNLKAVYNYNPRVYPGRITLFRASESLREHTTDDPMGWQSLAGGGLDVRIIEGTHRLIDEPYVSDVVNQLEEALAKTQAEVTGWSHKA